eukprot:TRINITY_DN19655_c0_g1_i1.p1 TRINITY_DN19655_c0_g1~~TRINITY_DN19655_c0_g1_i1.p1  ORF type:complete len:203 (+),score=5.22 TRINITY_DN19655_c0_g1_i1:95-703(+)
MRISCLQGVMIAGDVSEACNFCGAFEHVLVVEKDTIFFRLTSAQFPAKFRCLLITGKGYPSYGVRQFLCHVARHFPHVPISCLVDADPFGIDIYLQYKYGIQTVNYEQDWSVPSLTWLGLGLDDLPRDDSRLLSQAALKLTARDEMKLSSILYRHYMANEPILRRQLEDMKELQVKFEVESLNHLGRNALIDYLCKKLSLQS